MDQLKCSCVSKLFANLLASLWLIPIAAAQAQIIPEPVDPTLQRRYCDTSNPSGWGLYYCERQSDPESYVTGFPGGIAQDGGPFVPQTAGVKWGFLKVKSQPGNVEQTSNGVW